MICETGKQTILIITYFTTFHLGWRWGFRGRSRVPLISDPKIHPLYWMQLLSPYSKDKNRAPLVGQWWRTHQPMQETWVNPWPRKIPHAMELLNPCTTIFNPVLESLRAATTEPMCCNYWSPCALEPVLHNKRSHATRSLSTATRE